MLAELVPRGHLHHEGKAVGECLVHRFGVPITLIVVHLAQRRVHSGPAIDQLVQRDPLHPPLVDDGKQLVLQVGAAARISSKKTTSAPQMDDGVWTYCSPPLPLGSG